MNEELKMTISAEVQNFVKAMTDAVQALNKLTDAVSGAGEKTDKAMDEGTKSVKTFKDRVKDASKNVKSDFAAMGEGIKNGISKGIDAAKKALTALSASFVLVTKGTEAYRQDQAQLNAAFEQAKLSTESATKAYNQLYKVIGESDQAVESANNIAMLASSEAEVEKWARLASGVLGTFHDTLQPEAFYEAANETAKLGEATGAFTQMLEQTGVMSVEEFNKKLAACTTEAEKNALMLSVSEQALGGAGKAYDAATANLQKQREEQAKLQDTLAKVGEALTPVLTTFTSFANDALAKVLPYIQDLAEEYGPKLNGVLEKMSEVTGDVIKFVVDNWGIIATIGAVITGIAAAIGLYNLHAGIKAAMDAAQTTTLWGLVTATWAQVAASAAALAPYLLLVAGIAAVIAIIVVCIKHWDTIKEVVVSVAKGILEAVSNMVTSVIEFFKNLISTIVGAVVSFVVSIVDYFNQIKEGISSKISEAKSAVVARFEEIKTNISNKISSVLSTVTSVFNKIKTAITNPIETAKDAVSKVVDKIKGFFNFKVTLPKIKLPHFSITPKGWELGDLLKGKIPKLGIEWYAQGGVFDSPTLFNYANGRIGGLGEAGAEAIVPLEKNTQWLDKIADRLATRNQAPIVLQVNGRTFAQTVFDSINDYVAQTGDLPIIY